MTHRTASCPIVLCNATSIIANMCQMVCWLHRRGHKFCLQKSRMLLGKIGIFILRYKDPKAKSQNILSDINMWEGELYLLLTEVFAAYYLREVALTTGGGTTKSARIYRRTCGSSKTSALVSC